MGRKQQSGKQWLIETGLKLVRHHHQAIVLALEAVFDLLTFLQFVDRMFADRSVRLWMDEIARF